jgi:hypothetical protein
MSSKHHANSGTLSRQQCLIAVAKKEVQVMKDVVFAVTIFHSLAAVALFSVMVATVVQLVSTRSKG